MKDRGKGNVMKSIVLAVCSLVAAGTFGEIRSRRANKWSDPDDTWQMARHEEVLKSIARDGGAKVVFLGDSITHFMVNPHKGLAQWNKYYADGPCKALNLGFAGDLTDHVIWRITEGGELDGYEAKCIILEIGTNNNSHFPFDVEPPVDIILGIRRILEIIVEKQPKAMVVLHPLFPRQLDSGPRCVFRRRGDVVNKELLKFADGKRIFWCDFNDRLLTADGKLSTEIFPDQLHPGALGYEIWHAAVQPYIDAALSEGRLPPPVNRYAARVPDGLYAMDRTGAALPVSRIGFGLDDPWLNRILEHRREIAASDGTVDICFFGDDPFEGLEKEGEEALAELRRTYSVFTFGCAGDTIANAWWRAASGELDGFKAKCIVVTIGQNNSCDKDRLEAMRLGYRDFILKVVNRQLASKIVLLPTFPTGDSPEDRRRVAAKMLYEAGRRTVVDGTRIRWVDFNDRFLDEKGSVRKYAPDGVRLNAAAYRDVILPALLPHFKEICGK